MGKCTAKPDLFSIENILMEHTLPLSGGDFLKKSMENRYHMAACTVFRTVNPAQKGSGSNPLKIPLPLWEGLGEG
ncbi:MAG: hypothetical protein AB7S75_22355 [Desulfococcaceae bacterium]